MYGSFPVKSNQYSGQIIKNEFGTITSVGWAYTSGFSGGSRSGTNTSQKLSTAPRSVAAKVPVQIIKTIYSGPKLGYKVKTRSGKTVWARKPIQIYSTKFVWPKKRTPNRGADLLPNALSLYKYTSSFDDGPKSWTAFGQGANTGKSYTITGDYGTSNIETNVFGSPSQLLWWAPDQNTIGSLEGNYATDIAALTNQCAGAILDKIKDQAANLAQAFAERRQTAKLIADTISTAARAFRDIKKGNIFGAVSKVLPNSPKGVANGYLAYQYGVKPLLQDVAGSATYIAKTMYENSTKFLDVVVTRSKEIPETLVKADGINRSFVYAATYVRRTTKITVKLKYRFLITQSGLKSLSQTGLTNLPALGWELLPYSFVVDWFLPIGDFLNRQDALTGVTFLHGHQTVVTEQKFSYQRIMGGGATTANFVGPVQTFTGRASVLRVNRSIITSPLAVPKITFQDPVSIGHISNAVALLTQLFSKR